ncbi:MAG: hypothetical protein AAB776_01155, partial [Patescibacteria group bacterium]
MSKPKGGLGRGLGSLIGPGSGSVPVTQPTPMPQPVVEDVSPVVAPVAFTPEPIDTGEGDLCIRYVSPGDIKENTQ